MPVVRSSIADNSILKIIKKKTNQLEEHRESIINEIPFKQDQIYTSSMF